MSASEYARFLHMRALRKALNYGRVLNMPGQNFTVF